jgi:hypothetical protein
MDVYEWAHSAFTIALPRFLYMAIIMDLYEEPHSTLNIALPRGLYLALFGPELRAP